MDVNLESVFAGLHNHIGGALAGPIPYRNQGIGIASHCFVADYSGCFGMFDPVSGKLFAGKLSNCGELDGVRVRTNGCAADNFSDLTSPTTFCNGFQDRAVHGEAARSGDDGFHLGFFL